MLIKLLSPSNARLSENTSYTCPQAHSNAFTLPSFIHRRFLNYTAYKPPMWGWLWTTSLQECSLLICFTNISKVIKSRKMRWAGHVARVRQMRNAYKILVGNLKRRSFGRYRRRWEDSIRIDRSEMGWKHVERMHVAQNRDQWQVLVNMVISLCISQNARNFLTSWMTISFSRRTLLHGVS
jgi:hypothetical protein